MLNLAPQTQQLMRAPFTMQSLESMKCIAQRRFQRQSVQYNFHSSFKGVPCLSEMPTPLVMTGFDGFAGIFRTRNLNFVLQTDEWDSVQIQNLDQAQALVGSRIVKQLKGREHVYGLVHDVTVSDSGVIFVLAEGGMTHVLPVTWNEFLLVFQHERTAEQEFLDFVRPWFSGFKPTLQSSLQSVISIFHKSGFFSHSRLGFYERDQVIDALSESARQLTGHNQLITAFDAFKDLDTGLCGLVFFYHPELEHNDSLLELVRRMGVFANIPIRFKVDPDQIAAPKQDVERWDFKSSSELGLTQAEAVNVLREFQELFVDDSDLIDQAGLFAVGKKFGVEIVVTPEFTTADKDRLQYWLLERRCLLRVKATDNRQIPVKSASQFLVLD